MAQVALDPFPGTVKRPAISVSGFDIHCAVVGERVDVTCKRMAKLHAGKPVARGGLVLPGLAVTGWRVRMRLVLKQWFVTVGVGSRPAAGRGSVRELRDTRVEHSNASISISLSRRLGGALKGESYKRPGISPSPTQCSRIGAPVARRTAAFQF
jgi:hypothetical protein